MAFRQYGDIIANHTFTTVYIRYQKWILKAITLTINFVNILSNSSVCDYLCFRVLMVLQAQLELQAREALWVFLVKEESGGCQAFQDQLSVFLMSCFCCTSAFIKCHLQN